MKWRIVLPALLVLFLLLPMAWLLSITMSGFESGTQVPLPQGKTLVPMLSHEERMRLTTYAHDCRTDADCEPQLRCVYDVRTLRQHCTDSSCWEDEHCPEGFACTPSGAVNNKDLIRVCALVGVRKEGELCRQLSADREDSCAKGLLCQGFCGRPCLVDEPAGCPTGYYCRASGKGSSCMPTCEGRSCPAGQRCVELLGGQGSVCMTIHGQDCQQSACPPGLHCTTNAYPSTPGHIWMECLRRCGGKQPPCPEGTACFLFQCRKSCDPQDSSVCGSGFVCGRNHPSQPWACVPGLTEED